MIKRFVLSLIMFAAMTVAGNATVVFVPIFVPQPARVPGVSTADYQTIHTVAIVSALGTQLTFRNNHFLAPKSGGRDITDWKLDDEIAARLKQFLSGRFTFKDIAYDRAALAKIPNGPLDGLGSKFPAFLHNLPSDGIDAYVVVRPNLGYGAPGIEGLGLENGGPFGDMTPVVWANYEVDIVDVRTAKVIARAESQLRLRDKTPPSFAGLLVGDALKVGDDFQLSDNQGKLLRANFSFLLHRSLIETLRALDLGIELPPAGTRDLAPIPPDKDPYRSYKTVAVLSGVCDVLDLEHMGGTIFSRDSFAVPEEDWQLDAMLEKRAQDALAKKFTVKTVAVDHTVFAKAHLLDDDGKYAPEFPGLPTNPDVDLYVMLVKVRSAIPPMVVQGTGMGVFNKSLIGATTVAFANYGVAVVDAHSMKIVSALRAVPSPARPQEVPIATLDASVWPATPPNLAPDQATKIRDTLTDLLTDSEDELLLRLGVTGTIVTDDAPPDSSPSGLP